MADDNKPRNHGALYWLAMLTRHRDPQGAIQTLEQARESAQQAGDLNAVLEYNHWILQTLIFKLRDIKTAYPLAVAMAVEARKDQYQRQQEHICVYQDLILTYMYTDPIGHADLIEEALDYMQGQIRGQRIQCRLCMQALRYEFEVERGDYAAARREIDQQLAYAQGSRSQAHHEAQTYTMRAMIAYYEDDPTAIIEAASTGAERTRNDTELLADYCIAQMALAYAHEREGSRAASERHYRAGAAAAENSAELMPREYYLLARAVHTAREDHEAALRLADLELARTAGLGQTYRDAWTHVARCAALRALGRLSPADVAAATTAVNALRAPDTARAHLNALTDA